MKPSIFLSILVLTGSSCFGASVNVPFTTNFDSYAVNTDVSALLSEANNNSANSAFVDLGSGDLALRQNITASTGTNNTAVSVSTPVATLVSGGGFEFSTTFTLDSFTIGSSGIVNTSLNALSSSNSLGTGYRLNYTLNDGGSLVLSQSGATAGFSNIVAATNLTPVAGQTYTMTLRGIYTSATTLNLFGSISNGTTTVSTSASDSSIPVAADNNFGIRTASGNSTTNSAVQLTTTSLSLISVPEPTSALLAALAGGVFGFRRRRA